MWGLRWEAVLDHSVVPACFPPTARSVIAYLPVLPVSRCSFTITMVGFNPPVVAAGGDAPIPGATAGCPSSLALHAAPWLPLSPPPPCLQCC